jgi:hypothetical protein
MDASTRFEKALVKPQELGVGESFFDFTPPKLRIGEGDPDLLHFSGCKIFSDPIDLGAEERNVVQSLDSGGFCPHPKAIAFDVDSDEISLRMQAGQANGILSLTAGQLKCNGLIVLKMCMPVARHVFWELKDLFEGFQFGKSYQFFLSHVMFVTAFSKTFDDADADEGFDLKSG